MDINFPNWADTDLKKWACCAAEEEILLVIHNKKGKKYDNGEITEEQWHNFLNWYAPRDLLVRQRKVYYRDLLKATELWAIGLDPRDFFTD